MSYTRQMDTKYSKKKMIVAGRALVVNRCLADNSRKTQCNQAALKDHICCQFHYMTCNYESVVDATIIDSIELEAKKERHTVDQSAKKRWATMLEYVSNNTNCL